MPVMLVINVHPDIIKANQPYQGEKDGGKGLFESYQENQSFVLNSKFIKF